MASNCTLGIQNLVKTTLNNKPWFEYDQSLGIVNILDSFTKKINKENSHGVAKTTAITINKQINDGYKNIGDIAFVKSNKEGRGYIDIAPSINQIYLINAQNEKEINELQQQLDEEDLLKGFSQTRETGNYDVVDGEIVVSTNNGFNNEYSLNNFQEEQKELDKIVTKINNESRQLDLFESFQNIITNENKPTPIDTTKSAGLLWGKMSSYESETNFQPTESKSQYRSDNSLQEKINGRSFKEIWNSNEFTQLERENILLHSIQERMFDKNTFNGELFAGINSKLGKLELRVVDNEKYPFLAFQKQIYINPKIFLKYLQNANIENVDKYLDLTVSEELIHVLTNYFTSLEDIKKIATEINPNNFKYIQSIYKSLPSGDFELGTREYLRMIVQQEILGTTTEKIKYTKNGVIDSIIDKIWNFLYQIFKDNKGTLAENVKKHIDFIKSNNVDSTNTYKPDISQVETSLSQDIKYQLSKEQSNAIDNVFDENPELADAVYSVLGFKVIKESDITYTDEEGKTCAEMGLTTNQNPKFGDWEIIKDLKGSPTHKQGGIDLSIKGNTIEAEGNELVLKNSVGDLAIIPKKDRLKIKDLIADNNEKALNNYISALPKNPNKAGDGGIYSDKYVKNNFFNRIFRRNNILEKQIMDENRSLYNVGKLKDFKILEATGKSKQHLEKTNRNPEYFPKGDTWFPYLDDVSQPIKLPNKNKYRTLVNDDNLSDDQLKNAVKFDFISHSLHNDKRYNDLSTQLSQKLLTKYDQKFIDNNGGVDAYVRGILSDSEDYKPYKDETSFIEPEFINEFKNYIKTGK